MAKTQQITKTVDDFEIDAHLWNIFTGGSGKSLILLKKLVDAVQWGRLYMKSILLHGREGTNFLSKILINSLQLSDVRICEGRYFDCGIPSETFFENSTHNDVAHLILDIESIRGTNESVLWKYLKLGWCQYNKPYSGKLDVYCNALIVLTTSNIEAVPRQLLNAIEYKIEVEPFNNSQLELVIVQRLKYCGISYDEEILKKIVEVGMNLKFVMALLKTSLTIMNSEGRTDLTLKDVEMAVKLS
ncbi:MAG: hypothetical protein ACYC54_14960 [Sedimentisphaerales bacterium]